MATVVERAGQFMARFNVDDLDGVVATLAPDGVFVDPFGATFTGRDAIRATLAPYFAGEAGVLRYEVSEILADETTGRALVAWTMTVQTPDASSRIDGLDILHFEGDLIKRKNSFCKASALHAR